MQLRFGEHDLLVRPMRPADVEGYFCYLENLSQQDLARMGIARERLDLSAQARQRFCLQLMQPREEQSEVYLVWEVDGDAIGHNALKDIKPEQGAGMHLHMWKAPLRGKGLGKVLFCMAALEFYSRFPKIKIICEPAEQNPMPNRMLESIGFKPIGKRFGRSSSISDEMNLMTYEIGRGTARNFIQQVTAQSEA